jgi:WD40 repeat protein
MIKSPFKFLDSFTLVDREIFFGRDQEIPELYRRVFESKILLVYGISGTGKSSLVNCGLASRFDESDWLPVNVRRGSDIIDSLNEAFNKQAIRPLKKSLPVSEKLQSIYLDHFKPVYLIFDQFEELFIFGSQEEKTGFIKLIKEITESETKCRVIFIIREEFLAGMTEFESELPDIFANRFRVEKMKRTNAISASEGPCKVYNIETEPGFSEELIDKLCHAGNEIELTYLQIYLDRIFRIAVGERRSGDTLKFTSEVLAKAGNVSDLLGQFLEEQIREMDDPETGMSILKSFVSVQGTRRQMTERGIMDSIGSFGTVISEPELLKYLTRFVDLRILRERDESGHFELRHDSLATKIYEKFTAIEKDIIEAKQFIENAFSVYEKRGKLITAEDLKYIAPYEDKLFLNEKILRFISHSKWSIHKARRRRQNIFVSTAIIIITVLSFFTVWALKERSNALKQKQFADEQTNSALREKEAADSARQEAFISRQEAFISRNLAVEQKNIADDQRRRAEINAIEAARQRGIALEQTDSAMNAGKRAERNAERANEERMETLRLRMLSVGKAMSIKSLQLQGQNDLQTLLAYQAYVFNSNYRGYSNDADIYQGLYNVARQYGSAHYKVFSGHNGEIKSIAFIPEEQEFFTSGFDGKLIKWSFKDSDKNQQVIYSGPEITEVLAVSPDKEWLACGGRNSVIRMIRIKESNALQYELKGSRKQINSLVYSNDGKFLYSASLDGKVLKWDLAKETFTEVETDMILITSIDISYNGNYLAGVSNDGKVLVWNPQKVSDNFRIEPSGKNVKTIKFKPEENLLAVGYSDGIVELWDISARIKISETNAHSAKVNAIRFNNALSQMATASNDGTLKIWDTKDMTTPPINFTDNEGFVMAIEFSPDGQFIVSGTYEGTNNLVGRATNADLLATDISGMVSRNLTSEEWSTYVAKDIVYEKPVLKKILISR